MEDAETRKETNPKKKNETKWKKDSINSAKFWIKNEEKEQIEQNTKTWKRETRESENGKKQRGPKNMFDFGVFFVVEDDLRSWSLTFFSEKKKCGEEMEEGNKMKNEAMKRIEMCLVMVCRARNR